MQGAGGTKGGIGSFFLGLGMFFVGLYLMLSNIRVTNGFGLSSSVFRLGGQGGIQVTTGYILIPFIIGIILIFYNAKSLIGWVLTVLSLGLLIFGIIASMRFYWQGLSAFDTLVIIVLLFGGLGIFLRSLKDFS
jgi:hypothetical protein